MQPRFSSFSTSLILGLSIALSSGCGSQKPTGPPVAKVQGKVIYKGQAVARADVTFMMEGAPRAATGTTNDKGEFQLTTFNTDDGAVVGTHKVTIVQNSRDPKAKSLTVVELAERGVPKPSNPSTIPEKYADLKTTPLKFPVNSGKQNEISIELTD